MRTVKLGEIITPARVQRAGQRDLPVLSMTMRDGLVLQDERFKKRIASASTHDYKVVQRGQLVVGFPIDEGVLDVQSSHEEAIVSPAYGIWDLKSVGSVDGAYLRKFLRSPEALAYYKAKLRGSTARRRSLPAEVFLALPVFLPVLSEQRRIAAILDQADAIRTKRRQVLTHLDALRSHLFRVMFGPAGSHTGGAHHVKLGDALSLKSGSFLPAKSQDGGAFPVYGGNGVTGHHSQALLEEPAVVVGRVGAYCGATHLTMGPCWVTDNALIVKDTSRQFAVTYLWAALTAANLNRYASQSGQPLISAARLANVDLLVPPVSAQEEFEDRLQAVFSQQSRARQAVSADDELFASLQSRAFRGEL